MLDKQTGGDIQFFQNRIKCLMRPNNFKQIQSILHDKRDTLEQEHGVSADFATVAQRTAPGMNLTIEILVHIQIARR